jgi:Suppressor of fused protein (SUFU)
VSARPGYVDSVVAHVERTWPGRTVDVLSFELGPLWEAHPHMRFVELEPADGGRAWTYISAGAAELLAREGVGHEFVIRAPQQERLMAEVLAMVVWYALTGDHDGVFDGHTLNIGAPWIEGSHATSLYVNKPYFVSHEFEFMRFGDKLTVHFLWLVPITPEERDWRHEHGQEAFERRLETERIDPTDPHRPSVVS